LGCSKGLVRRPFTIDMWDFEVARGDAPRHTIDATTRWGIFYGDNTGMVQALHMLSTIETLASVIRRLGWRLVNSR
jgi:hypothetical protein